MGTGSTNARLAFSPACERNKKAILTVLTQAFSDCRCILEIGSGTGQHAVHFAAALAPMRRLPSDQASVVPTLAARITAEAGTNCAAPVALDVATQPWPVAPVDGVFSANTLHIMSWAHVQSFFSGLAQVLQPGGRLCLYGPFRYDKEFTSLSNASFDASLRRRDPASGIRDFEAVQELARGVDLVLQADIAMPANNQLIIWERHG
jgi:SAM-dependent methyltransferase